MKSLDSLQSKDQIIKGIAFGIINGIMVVPVMISFCSIIFRNNAYADFQPALVNSLPFAVGQVQDAGLIFLSAMASSVVELCDTSQIVPTALFLLGGSTALLGLTLIITGKLRLASAVQYLPMPVVGGYLAFIGFFCGEAGLAMMAGVQVTSMVDWDKFGNEKAMLLLTPGLVLGISIYILLRNIRSPYTLPICLVVILVVFYAVLGILGISIEEAREYGWISPAAPPAPFYEAWSYYDFRAVDWSVFPIQIPRWVGMFLVVAFSSSLDVAAIEMELGLPMDYDRELSTVGISNLASGLLGGYTGSYIFSQTIFTMRRNVQSRVCGYTIFLIEIAVLMMPFSITSFVPKLFFGSLLVLISCDLMWEWLISSRSKMMLAEYLVCLLTFVAIQITGIEIGMFIGVIFSVLSFVVSYAKLPSVSVTSQQTSNVVRTFEERAVLFANRGRIVTISLQGYIFFGSAVKILSDVKKHVIIAPDAEHSSMPEPSPVRTPRSNPSQLPQERSSLIAIPSSVQQLQSVYTMSSEEILHHHEKWAQNCGEPKVAFSFSSSNSMLGRGPILQNDETVIQSTGLYPDEELTTNGEEQIVTADGYQPDYADLSPSESVSRLSPVISDSDILYGSTLNQFKLSVLSSVWSGQSEFRSQRKRSSSNLQSIKSVGSIGSRSALRIQGIDDELSPLLGHHDVYCNGTFNHATAAHLKPSQRTEYLILDFSAVRGLDATAARSCFLMLLQILRGSGATVVFAGLKSAVQELLQAHGVIIAGDAVMCDLNDAIEWCEEQVLLSAKGAMEDLHIGLNRDPVYYAEVWRHRQEYSPKKYIQNADLLIRADSDSVQLQAAPKTVDDQPYRRLRRILMDYLEVDPGPQCPSAVRQLLRQQILRKYFHREHYRAGTVVYEMEQAANKVYFLDRGIVELFVLRTMEHLGNNGEIFARISKVSSGGVFGDASFFLSKTYSTRALVSIDSVIWSLTKTSFAVMEQEHPKLCILLQHVLLKSMAMSQASSLQATLPASSYNLFFE